MRMSHAPQHRRPDLFVSAKSRSAIPLPDCALVEDALVQASLDPAVRSLAFVPAAGVPSAPVGCGIILVERDDGRFWLDVEAVRPLRTTYENRTIEGLACEGLLPITLTSEEILREPRFANSRQVWSHRDHPVGFALRVRLLEIIDEEGPLRLGRLLTSIWSDRDPAPAVLALACADLLELDLVSRPLGPATMVRARSRR